MKLRSFRNDKRGIIIAGIIAITFIILSSIVWLVGALIVNRFFDALLPTMLLCDPQVLIVNQNAVNAYGISIIPVDVCFLIWWAVSAQKKEVVEEDVSPY
jgi:hypothetical protein